MNLTQTYAYCAIGIFFAVFGLILNNLLGLIISLICAPLAVYEFYKALNHYLNKDIQNDCEQTK